LLTGRAMLYVSAMFQIAPAAWLIKKKIIPKGILFNSMSHLMREGGDGYLGSIGRFSRSKYQITPAIDNEIKLIHFN
jgi:hypothetical protein